MQDSFFVINYEYAKPFQASITHVHALSMGNDNLL
jgi:hypothetical protein